MDYNDKKTQKRIAYALDTVEMCWGGKWSHWEIILKMLERAEAGGYFCDPLDDIPGPAVEFIAKCLDGMMKLMSDGMMGLLDSGDDVDIDHATITDNGKLVLQFLRDHGTDSSKWPKWWVDMLYVDETGDIL